MPSISIAAAIIQLLSTAAPPGIDILTSTPCTGPLSSKLAPSQCVGWQSLHDALFSEAKGCTAARNSPCDACSQGVRCNGTDITSITLGQISLIGTIPSEIGTQLPHLEVLELGFNNITGAIPASLVGLTNLRDLVVNNNSMSGRIPAFRFDQFTKLHGFCALGNQYGAKGWCAPLPPGAAACNNWGPVTTTQPC
jgi:hypothetical protein